MSGSREEHTATVHTIAALSRAVDLKHRYEQLMRKGGPDPESPAARDMERCRLVETTLRLATGSLFVGLDNVVSVKPLLVEEGTTESEELAVQFPTFAHFTLVRAAVEGATMARWLCCRGSTWKERAERTIGAESRDYHYRKQFERDSAEISGPRPVPPGAKTAEERIDDSAALSEKLGIAGGKSARWPRSWVDLCGTYVSEAADEPARGRYFYRLLSALAHGQRWALLPVSDFRAISASSDSKAIRSLTAKPVVAAWVVEVAVETLAAALDDLEWYVTAEP